MKKLFIYIGIFIFSLTLLGCADSVNVQQCVSQEPDGFWWGLLHGIITPIIFIVSLFNDSVSIYSVNNSGGWYDFGFLLGIGSLGINFKRTKTLNYIR